MSASTTPFRARSLAVLLFTFSLAMAQAPAPAAPKESEYVTTRDFKSKVFAVKHRSPHRIAQILRPLGSGFKGATLSSTEEEGLAAITVRDFPENIASIEEALKRLDVPSAAAKEVEFHIHVLFASKTQGPSEEFPEELRDVLVTLKSTLQYKSYTLATSFVQRAAVSSNNFGGMGEIAAAGASGANPSNPLKLKWGIYQCQIETPAEGPSSLKLSKFLLQASDQSAGILASVLTDLSLKDGEKVVVGTSVLKDRGLIVVLTAKVLK